MQQRAQMAIIMSLFHNINHGIGYVSMVCLAARMLGVMVSTVYLQATVLCVLVYSIWPLLRTCLSVDVVLGEKLAPQHKSWQWVKPSWIIKLLQIKQACYESPHGFSLLAAMKLQAIIGHLHVQFKIGGALWAWPALLMSLYVWRLRWFEYSNSALKATRYETKNQFLLASSCLHFVLETVATCGGFLSGWTLAAAVTFCMLGIAYCAKINYAGCYYAGGDQVPWELQLWIREKPARMAHVYKRAVSQGLAQRIIARFAHRWVQQYRKRIQEKGEHPSVLNQFGLHGQYQKKVDPANQVNPTGPSGCQSAA